MDKKRILLIGLVVLFTFIFTTSTFAVSCCSKPKQITTVVSRAVESKIIDAFCAYHDIVDCRRIKMQPGEYTYCSNCTYQNYKWTMNYYYEYYMLCGCN